MSACVKTSVFSNEKQTNTQGHREARNEQNNKEKVNV